MLLDSSCLLKAIKQAHVIPLWARETFICIIWLLSLCRWSCRWWLLSSYPHGRGNSLYKTSLHIQLTDLEEILQSDNLQSLLFIALCSTTKNWMLHFSKAFFLFKKKNKQNIFSCFRRVPAWSGKFIELGIPSSSVPFPSLPWIAVYLWAKYILCLFFPALKWRR